MPSQFGLLILAYDTTLFVSSSKYKKSTNLVLLRLLRDVSSCCYFLANVFLCEKTSAYEGTIVGFQVRKLHLTKNDQTITEPILV